MPAYVIANVDVTDAAAYDEYRKGVLATIERYDGRFLVRGGAAQVLEGTFRPKRVVVLEFPNAARARAWWDSPEYAEARELRQRTCTTKMIIVEGV